MNYEWFQDSKQIKLRFDIKNTTLKNIQVEIADVAIKVNVLDKKYAKTLDLYDQITEGGIVYGNNILEVTLHKVKQEQWPSILADLPKEELLKRRKDAFFRKEQADKAKVKQKEDLKLEFDKHSTKEQMRIEDIQRKVVSDVKQSQKDQALEELYSNVDENAKFQNDQNVDEKIKKYEEQEQQKEQEQLQSQKGQQQVKEKNQIFTNKEVNKKAHPLPEPRQSQAVQLTFTEKVYPHLAARESHYKDAPLPRLQKLAQKGEKENPLFLKDKGDEFYRNKDYYSAINAYSVALKFDPQLISALANRSACNLCLYNYDECIDDCQKVVENYQNKEQDELYQKTIRRLRVCRAWKGDLEESKEGMNEQFIELITQRQNSLQIKAQGDYYYSNGQLERSIAKYKEALAISYDNELVQSNMGLVYMKMKLYEEAIGIMTVAIEKAQRFLMHVNLNPNVGTQSAIQAHDFLLKNYMRRANCLFQLNKEEEALLSVKQALKIDETNEEARLIMSKIQIKLEKNEALKLKELGTEQLREKKYEEALNLYNESLKKLTASEDLIDFLGILLNKCTCCYFLEQFDEIIGCCSRGIKIIQNQNNKILAFEKISKETKDTLNSYYVRFLVRRSNAYLKQYQIYHAKCDLQEALKLDPNNQQILNDLNKIKG